MEKETLEAAESGDLVCFFFFMCALCITNTHMYTYIHTSHTPPMGRRHLERRANKTNDPSHHTSKATLAAQLCMCYMCVFGIKTKAPNAPCSIKQKLCIFNARERDQIREREM